MDVLGYIYEVIGPTRMDGYIGPLEEEFLEFILRGTSSAYQIFSRLKKEKDMSPIAYKNVHRRIKKLLELNMIEEIKTQNGFKHGARNFRLNTRGIVYIFSELGVPHKNEILLSYYSENTLFKTFLYPYLETNTIKSATYSLLKVIENYLEECCRITRYALHWMTDYADPTDPNTTWENMLGSPPIEVLQYQLNWHIQSFILKLCILTEDTVDWRHYPNVDPATHFPSMEKIRCTANDRIETFDLLAHDKKFMKALGGIEKRFSEGYSKIIELRSRKRK
jgi:hypothetical protein